MDIKLKYRAWVGEKHADISNPLTNSDIEMFAIEFAEWLVKNCSMPAVVGQNEQLIYPDCADGRDEFEPYWKCPDCRQKDDVNNMLSAGLSRQIMEATGRFEFVKEDPETSIMTFWDNCWEKEYSIGADWTLEELMRWITNFYAEYYERRGELKAQRKMRSALGLD